MSRLDFVCLNLEWISFASAWTGICWLEHELGLDFMIEDSNIILDWLSSI
jgi:hypothetical protein